MKLPKKSRKKLLHKNPFSKVYYIQAEFDQFVKSYYVTHFGPRVGIVAIRENKVLLTRQYRLLPDQLTFEIPGGSVENNETPEIAIARECLEETGVACRNLCMLLKYYPGLDNVDNKTTIFYSEETHDAEPFYPVQHEVVEVVWMPVEKCFDKIYSGAILDALTIIGLHSYYRFRTQKQEEG